MATVAIPTPSIPISRLQPGLDAEATSVTGIVTLIWPYASSTLSTSLLLVEPDFRLRRHRGQVRIHFNGASAKAVAKSNISSGDQLSLSLIGSEWAKDGFAATTPGKGIEWELRYRERIVLQVQRISQEPVFLDVNDPSPSPELVPQASIPRISPPSSGYVATSMRKSLLNGLAWQSPAFLKRSRFLTSTYDPFAEVEEDFPDNDRNKRSKFGHGSGQWRFTDRTPSPEKEPETDRFNIPSPSKPRNREQVKLEGISTVPEMASSREQHSHGDQSSHEGAADMEKGAANFIPPSPPSTAIESTEVEEATEMVPTLQPGPTSPQSPYSTSVPSEPDGRSCSQAEDESEIESSDDVEFSGPVSDFGLDGSAFSRAQPPLKDNPPIETRLEEHGQRMEEDVEPKSTSQPEIASLLEKRAAQVAEDFAERLSATKESAYDFLLPDHGDSVSPSVARDLEQDAQRLFGVPPPSFDQLEDLQVQGELFEDIRDITDNGSAHTVQPIHHDDGDDSVPSSQAEDDEQNASQASNVSPPSYDQLKDQQSQVEPLGDVSKIADNEEIQSVSPKGKSSEAEDGAITSEALLVKHPESQQSQVATTDQEQINAKSRNINSTVEIIDLESDEEEDMEQLSFQKPDLSPYIPPNEAAVNTPEDTARPRSPSGIVTLEEPQASSQALNGDAMGVTVRSRKLSVSSEPARPLPHSEVLAANEQISGPQLFEFNDPPKLKSDVKTDDKAHSSFVELPSTVQDSVQASSKSQLLTPDTTQRTSFASQPSFTSLQSALDDDTLPTPRLTQGRSADLIVPPALSQELSLVRASSPPDQKPLLIEEKSTEKPRTPQKPTTLIERLKAMRRLSGQVTQKMGDTSAISPWFTPKRSGQIVPDSEAESEIESSSEGDQRIEKLNPVAKLETPEKQKPLAKAFVRSPPQRDTIPSIASSPGYLPPSQPPPPGFRTSLSYFVPLATLPSHFSTTVDILAIALNASSVTRAASGPRDYNQTIYVTDPSSSSLRPPTIMAQIFRSHNKCFPLTQKGDALLLRDFKVQSFQRRPALLSTQSSAWAVFREISEVQIRGPPVEFGAEERGFARGLWRWWAELSEDTKGTLDAAVPKEKEKKTKAGPKSNVTVKKEGEKLNGTVKKEGIEGLGVDLPGSQGKTRKISVRERSLALDGVLESTEPPKRILRPRGARGIPERSESPIKARSTRHGTVFTGGLGEPESD